MSVKKVSNGVAMISLSLALFSSLFNGEVFVLLIITSCLILLAIQLRNKDESFPLPTENVSWLTTLALHQFLVVGFYAVFLEKVNLPVSGPLFSVLIVLHAIVLCLIHKKSFNHKSKKVFFILIDQIKLSDFFLFTLPNRIP